MKATVEATPPKQPARTERRRRQIIEAAAKCFARTGFAKTTIADIAAQANLSKPALYAYFENKEAIIAALEDQLVTNWTQATRLPPPEQGGYCQAIAHSFQASFDFFFSQPVIREFFLMQANMFVVGHDTVITAAISRVRDRLADFIAEGQKAGEIRRTIDAAKTAELLRIMHVAVLGHASVAPDGAFTANHGLADLSIEMTLRLVSPGAPAA
jgi:AcrR family transcriptional regulator